MRDDLAVARVNKATDNKDVAVRDLLITALADLDSGQLKADSCLLIFVEKKASGWSTHSYRAQLDRCVACRQHRHIEDWLEG